MPTHRSNQSPVLIHQPSFVTFMSALVLLICLCVETGSQTLTTTRGSKGAGVERQSMLEKVPESPLVSYSQQGSKLVGASATGTNVQQGSGVALSSDGSTAIVGALGDNSNIGAAWFYTRSGSVWTPQGGKNVPSNPLGNPQHGGAVAISADGNTAIAGGTADNSSVGAAWIWVRSSGIWTQQAKLIASDSIGSANVGGSVAISADGNTVIIGGASDNTFIGAAWVFTRSGTVWTQQGLKLVGTGATGLAFQGRSVALSADGNTALVGGNSDNLNAGAVWAYTRSGGVWTQQGAKLVGTGATGTTSEQGYSVSLSSDGNTAAIGAYADNNLVGAVWIFNRSAGVWTQDPAGKLVGTGNTGGSQQGISVSLSGAGNRLIVGGQGDNSNVGAAWVWAKSAGVWSQQGSKLVGTGNVGGSQQGHSVSVSTDGQVVMLGGLGDNSFAGAAWPFGAPATAAGVSVSGRVTANDGRGVTNARVAITDPAGGVRTVLTGRGGSFFFDDVTPGQAYVVSVGSRRFSFETQVVFVTGNVTGVNFVGK